MFLSEKRKIICLNGTITGETLLEKIKELEEVNPNYKVETMTNNSRSGDETFVYVRIAIKDQTKLEINALLNKENKWISTTKNYRIFNITPELFSEEPNKEELSTLVKDIQTLFKEDSVVKENPFLNLKEVPYSLKLERILKAAYKVFGKTEKLRGTGSYIATIVKEVIGLPIINGKTTIMLSKPFPPQTTNVLISHALNFDKKRGLYVDLTLQQFDPELPNIYVPGEKYWDISDSGFPNENWFPHYNQIPEIAIYRPDSGLITNTDFPFIKTELEKQILKKLRKKYEEEVKQ